MLAQNSRRGQAAAGCGQINPSSQHNNRRGPGLTTRYWLHATPEGFSQGFRHPTPITTPARPPAGRQLSANAKSGPQKTIRLEPWSLTPAATPIKPRGPSSAVRTHSPVSGYCRQVNNGYTAGTKQEQRTAVSRSPVDMQSPRVPEV